MPKTQLKETEKEVPVSDGNASARGRFGAGPWLLSDGAVYIGLLKGRSTSASLGIYVTLLEINSVNNAVSFRWVMLALFDSVTYRGIKYLLPWFQHGSPTQPSRDVLVYRELAEDLRQVLAGSLRVAL
jgi:hypothetical protein